MFEDQGWEIRHWLVSFVCHAVLWPQDLRVPCWPALAGVGREPREEMRWWIPARVKAQWFLWECIVRGLHQTVHLAGQPWASIWIWRLLGYRTPSSFSLHFLFLSHIHLTARISMNVNSYDEALHNSHPVPSTLPRALCSYSDLIFPTTQWSASLSPSYRRGNWSI